VSHEPPNLLKWCDKMTVHLPQVEFFNRSNLNASICS